MSTSKQYDKEFKAQAVSLARKIGNKAAANELGIPAGTLGGWVHNAKQAEFATGERARTPKEAMNLAEKYQDACRKIKELERENKRLKEESEFLAGATAFFAASRQKSGK